jgi:starvation-inducible DNA-binding protein
MTKNASAPLCADTDVLRQDLQAVLSQLFDLHIQGVEAHAHFIGSRFTGIQRQLDSLVETAHDASVTVAELLCGFDGNSARGLILAAIPTKLPGLRPGERCATAAVNMITNRISALINTIRRLFDDLGGSDTSTTDLLGAIADVFDTQALLLVAEAQRINKQASAEGAKDD